MKSTAKSKGIKYGTKKILEPGDLDPRNVKERITIFLDEDIVNEFRKRAKEVPGGNITALKKLKNVSHGGMRSQDVRTTSPTCTPLGYESPQSWRANISYMLVYTTEIMTIRSMFDSAYIPCGAL